MAALFCASYRRAFAGYLRDLVVKPSLLNDPLVNLAALVRSLPNKRLAHGLVRQSVRFELADPLLQNWSLLVNRA